MNAEAEKKKSAAKASSSGSKSTLKASSTRAKTAKTTPKRTRTRNASKIGKKLPEELKWRVWPAADRPWLTVFASFVVLFTVLFFGFRIHLWAGALAFIVLFAMLNPYFIPTSYEMNSKQVIIHKFYYSDKRDWGMFRRFFLTRSGVVLSTFSKRKKFLDNFRGVQLFLPRNKEERDRILDFIENKLKLDSGQSRQ